MYRKIILKFILLVTLIISFSPCFLMKNYANNSDYKIYYYAEHIFSLPVWNQFNPTEVDYYIEGYTIHLNDDYKYSSKYDKDIYCTEEDFDAVGWDEDGNYKTAGKAFKLTDVMKDLSKFHYKRDGGESQLHSYRNIVIDDHLKVHSKKINWFNYFDNGARIVDYPSYIDITKLDTSSITSMKEMFRLTGVEIIKLSGIDTKNVVDMTNMFGKDAGNPRIYRIDINNINTSKVTDMTEMFNGCTNLTGLDLSSFDTKNVTSMEGMFANCFKLKTIYTSDKFVVNYELDPWKFVMFNENNELVGGRGTEYKNALGHYSEGNTGEWIVSEKIQKWLDAHDNNYNLSSGCSCDFLYANIDTASNPGFFTDIKKAEYYKIAFDANGGKGSMSSVNNVMKNIPVELPRSTFKPSNKNDMFKYWYIDETNTYNNGDIISISKNTSLKAKWGLNIHLKNDNIDDETIERKKDDDNRESTFIKESEIKKESEKKKEIVKKEVIPYAPNRIELSNIYIDKDYPDERFFWQKDEWIKLNVQNNESFYFKTEYYFTKTTEWDNMRISWADSNIDVCVEEEGENSLANSIFISDNTVPKYDTWTEITSDKIRKPFNNEAIYINKSIRVDFSLSDKEYNEIEVQVKPINHTNDTVTWEIYDGEGKKLVATIKVRNLYFYQEYYDKVLTDFTNEGNTDESVIKQNNYVFATNNKFTLDSDKTYYFKIVRNRVLSTNCTSTSEYLVISSSKNNRRRSLWNNNKYPVTHGTSFDGYLQLGFGINSFKRDGKKIANPSVKWDKNKISISDDKGLVATDNIESFLIYTIEDKKKK